MPPAMNSGVVGLNAVPTVVPVDHDSEHATRRGIYGGLIVGLTVMWLAGAASLYFRDDLLLFTGFALGGPLCLAVVCWRAGFRNTAAAFVGTAVVLAVPAVYYAVLLSSFAGPIVTRRPGR